MSSTNKTLTIELSQYVGTDKPTYLTDYNGDMLKIDNAIAADRDGIATAQNKADGADAKADINAGAIATLDGQINNASNGLTKRVTDVEGDVNTIESLIGNGTPTTTDKTIIGAINELNAEMPSGTAAGTSYDNTNSGLTATNVQEAIDALTQSTFPDWGNATAITATVGVNTFTPTKDGYISIICNGGGATLYLGNVQNNVRIATCYADSGKRNGMVVPVKKGTEYNLSYPFFILL